MAAYGREIEIPSLRFDTNRAISILEGAQGSVREGSLLLLAHSDSMSIDDTKPLLALVQSDYEPVERSWAELIKGTVRHSETPDAMDFLESILSKVPEYPKAVKYAALEKYNEIARSTTIDIQEQERDLGLPLQDIGSA